MSRWFANVLLLLVAASATAQDAPSYLLPGRLGAGATLWAHDAVVGKWHGQSTGLVDVQYASVTLLSGATCTTNRLAGSWTLTDAGLNTLLGRRGGGRGTWTLMGQIEDHNEADVLQRTRLTFALGRSVQLNPSWEMRLALHGGKGWRRWMADGIWDSQYLANPVDPASAASGEIELTDSRSYFEGGFELGLNGAHSRLAYRWLHLPSNQSLLGHDGALDPYTVRHSFLATTRHEVQQDLEATGWAAFETQGGARLLTLGAAAAWAFGEDSQITGHHAATVVSAGLVYRSTGHLSPLVHVAWKRRWIVWLAPDVAVGTPDGRAASGGMQLGLRARIG